MTKAFRSVRAGLAGGVGAGLAIVALESVIIRLWWAGVPIPPPALARTQMFDSLSETVLLVTQRLGAQQVPVFSNLAYPSGWAGLWLLIGVLSWAVLPLALAVGGLYGVWRWLRGSLLGAGSAALFVVSLAAAVDLALWLNSIHFPSAPTAYLIVRNAAKSFVLDGEWVSAVTFVLCAVLAWVSRRGEPRESALLGRPALGLLLVGCAGVALLTGLANARRDDSLKATQPRVQPRKSVVSGTLSGRPNILLISIDSLRADHLGCYGWTRNTSPAIDALAASGVRYSNAWSTTSWTLPSHVSMLSGRSLLGHGVLESGDAIPNSLPLLAPLLKASGYRTAAFVSAPYLSSSYGFARGFDTYDDRTVSFSSHKDSHSGITSPLVHGAASGWLRAQRERAGSPFFLFVHYWDVHYDYMPPPPFNKMFDPDYTGSISSHNLVRNPYINPDMEARDLEHILALYDGEIRFTDSYVGRLLSLVKDLGLARNTVVILTADHGEEFFEHGNKAHQRTLYEEVLHVPLIVSWPGVFDGGVVKNEPVGIIDITPTILRLAGVLPPAGIEGRDLLEPSGGGSRRPLVGELYRKSSLNLQVALKLGQYKLIQSLNYPRSEFFDLAADPGERSSLPSAREKQQLSASLLAWVQNRWGEYSRREAAEGHNHAVVSKQHMEALRALGYVE